VWLRGRLQAELNSWRFRRRTIQSELQNGNGLCESYTRSS